MRWMSGLDSSIDTLLNSRGTSLSALSVGSTYLVRPLTLNVPITPTAVEPVTLKIPKCRRVCYSLRMKSLNPRLLATKSIGSDALPWEGRETRTNKYKALADLKSHSKSLKLTRFCYRTLTYSLWCVKYIKKVRTLRCLTTWLKLSKSMIPKATGTTLKKTSSTQYSVSLNRLNQLTLWSLC